MADLTNDFVSQVREAVAANRTLNIEGSGSKHWYGNTAQAGMLINTKAHAGVVDYDPAELVLTARTGTSLIELESMLAAQGQMLAFEPPRHASGSTLGGAISTALSGPGRPYVGGVRDFVLGMHVIDGRGDVLKFGGQVMKNVAGYDVSRLMTGAMGTLGLMTQVSLKVLPLPVAHATLTFEQSEADAIRCVNEWSGRPLPLTATVWESGKLHVRLTGAHAAVNAAIHQLGGELMEGRLAAELWDSLRDQTHPFFDAKTEGRADKTLWRLSLPSIAPVVTGEEISGAESQLIEWGGAQRWLWSTDAAEHIRVLSRKLGGHAVRFDNRHPGDQTFDVPSAALMAIHRRLKHTFDPNSVFNPGRLYTDF